MIQDCFVHTVTSIVAVPGLWTMLLSGPQVDEEDEDVGPKVDTTEIIEELRKVTEIFDNKTEEYNNFEKLQATHKKV